MSLRAILFDHDGTLVDSEPVHYELWQTVLAQYGVSLSEQLYRQYYAGVPTKANVVDLVHRFELDELPETLAAAKDAATSEYLRRNAFPLMSGVLETIREFRLCGLDLAIVTGAGSESVGATLKANNLGDSFVTVVSGDDVHASKPAPDCYLLALQRLGLQASECLAIEDTQHGLNASHAAGISCLAVPTTMSMHHDFGVAKAILEGMPQVAEHVQQLLKVEKLKQFAHLG
ncbi:HAD family hydrolase [Nitrincola sp. A-D6]|uniref:HAD family hydrolase n=1 Tax=Nitrincola sp. A-D6 TaxID=1545442 RepID=UPI00068FD3D2|nr:HAD family phosphatase [Nitrincola sp. A-D6]